LRFKVDENLPCECAAILRDAGFDAETVTDEQLSGADDFVVADRCRKENRVLVTLDLDFANIRAYPPSHYSGIIVVRSKAQDKATLMGLVRQFLPILNQTSPEKQLWIVEQDRIRYREG